MPKIESEKIDCLHRPWSRPAPRGKIESVRTHSEVIEQFDSFSLLKLLFLVRNWHCWSRKAFPRQMTPQSREKTAKTAVFRHRWQAWKVVRSIAAVRQRPRTPRNWRCSLAFFETFLWHFNKKQRAEVIFRLSRLVSCKNQENGSGKRWSLHAPLKTFLPSKRFTLLCKMYFSPFVDVLGTVDFSTTDGNCAFRTCAEEKDRVIFQMVCMLIEAVTLSTQVLTMCVCLYVCVLWCCTGHSRPRASVTGGKTRVSIIGWLPHLDWKS